jgi:hypothetical protein
VELIETSTFTRQIAALLGDEEYGEFQARIAANPELGAIIRGGGGYAKFELPLNRAVSAAAPASYTIGRYEKM